MPIRMLRLGRQLAALWTVLWFCGVVAASGPHLVHHLADHPTHADQPRPPDCFLFSLVQHTPVAEDGSNPLPLPLPMGAPSVFALPLTVHAELWPLFLARAPPV
jgi:hypothetical protein